MDKDFYKAKTLKQIKNLKDIYVEALLRLIRSIVLPLKPNWIPLIFNNNAIAQWSVHYVVVYGVWFFDFNNNMVL